MEQGSESCRAVRRRFSAWRDGALPAAQAGRQDRHLLECAACAEAWGEYRAFLEGLAGAFAVERAEAARQAAWRIPAPAPESRLREASRWGWILSWGMPALGVALLSSVWVKALFVRRDGVPQLVVPADWAVWGLLYLLLAAGVQSLFFSDTLRGGVRRLALAGWSWAVDLAEPAFFRVLGGALLLYAFGLAQWYQTVLFAGPGR